MISAPKTWLSASLQIDDQAAILHRDHFVHRHDAGLDIHRDVGNLHAAHALADQPFLLAFAGIVGAALGDGVDAQQRAGVLPRDLAWRACRSAGSGRRPASRASALTPSFGATTSSKAVKRRRRAWRDETDTPPIVVLPPEPPELG